MRRNIFEILSKDFNIAYEIKTIWQLFRYDVEIMIPDNALFETYQSINILSFVDAYIFKYWKSRNRCISPLDMMNRLGINERNTMNIDRFSNEAIIVLEFIENMIKQCDIAMKNFRFDSSDNYKILKENITTFLDHFGYEKYYFEDQEQVIIIEKNSAAISAAEISEPEIAKKIIQYNHYTLKGDIEAKKEILITLSNEVEPQRKELEKVNKSFSDDLFFMFNNMNLRHNNKEPSNKYYKSFIATMDNNALESWYDETYQMILLAKLLLDNVARMARIKILKKNILGIQNESEVDN